MTVHKLLKRVFQHLSTNINLVAYAYSGEGVGTTALLRDGFSVDGKMRDSDGGYVQATYVIPTGTKLGVSYGVSKLDDNAMI